MLTPNEEKYLKTIPEDKIANVHPFNPKVKEVANVIIQQIKTSCPDLEVFFGGSSALGIAGQNDIDMNLLSSPDKYPKYLPALTSLFGEPKKTNPILVKWEFEKNGFEVELYLTDKNSSELQRQIKVNDLIKNNLEYQKEYQDIKLACNGLSFREYMKKKYEFFNKILNDND